MAIQYLNWFNVFVNEVAGSIWLFLLVMAGLIFGVGSWFRMPWKVSLVLIGTFITIFAVYTSGYYLFFYLIIAILFAITYRKIHQSIT